MNKTGFLKGDSLGKSKGQLGSIQGAAIGLLVLALVLALSFTAIDLSKKVVGNVSGANSLAQNATIQAEAAMKLFVDFLPLIGLVIVMGVVLFFIITRFSSQGGFGR